MQTGSVTTPFGRRPTTLGPVHKSGDGQGNQAGKVGGQMEALSCSVRGAASIGECMIVCCGKADLSDAQSSLVEELVSCIGKTIFVADEELMDADTAVSGSGPHICSICGSPRRCGDRRWNEFGRRFRSRETDSLRCGKVVPRKRHESIGSPPPGNESQRYNRSSLERPYGRQFGLEAVATKGGRSCQKPFAGVALGLTDLRPVLYQRQWANGIALAPKERR